ncbi:MAG: M23 family metallopeptidase [Patescibacteria group bacterium]|nr:M23 family metallopeptidase [Patescibacteria group bacterium]
MLTQRYSWRHGGIDIADRSMPLIYAAAGGTVIEVKYGGWNGGYGKYALVDHGNGYVTRYAHLSKLYVNAGDQVTAGQAIAVMGSTGRSTGPHLHFEIIENGARKNPLAYL